METGLDHYSIKMKMKFTPVKNKNLKTNKVKNNNPHKLIGNKIYPGHTNYKISRQFRRTDVQQKSESLPF